MRGREGEIGGRREREGQDIDKGTERGGAGGRCLGLGISLVK